MKAAIVGGVASGATTATRIRRIAYRILNQNGFECYNLAGGYRFYKTIHDEECLTQSSSPCGMDI